MTLREGWSSCPTVWAKCVRHSEEKGRTWQSTFWQGCFDRDTAGTTSWPDVQSAETTKKAVSGRRSLQEINIKTYNVCLLVKGQRPSPLIWHLRFFMGWFQPHLSLSSYTQCFSDWYFSKLLALSSFIVSGSCYSFDLEKAPFPCYQNPVHPSSPVRLFWLL